MTDFCPKCGKKAEDGEKVCSVCGEEIASISQHTKNDKKECRKNKISLFKRIILLMVVLLVLFIGCTVMIRYFSAGKNIANTVNTQKSELKILKKPIVKQNESVEEVANKYAEKNDIDEYAEEKNYNENVELNRKDEYMKMMAKLDKEALELADSELNGNQEKLLDYTSKIYKKYDTILNIIYKDISSVLEDKELEELKNEEIEWIKNKEEMASYAVGSEDTSESDETWAYFDSLATSTKERCYYLIHKYMY